MNNKCCFIIPYFGKLPNYFQLFLNSCAYNMNYNWLLITDDETAFNYPSNVKRIIATFDQIKQRFANKLGMDVSLPSPYKLCDYKPAYGFLFSDYLTGYNFWGHCDIDIIIGNLDAFINDSLLDNYDKLFCLGHFILYRNTEAINKVFMTDGHYSKKFTNDIYCRFNEKPISPDKITIDQLFLKKKLRVFGDSYAMDVHVYEESIRRVLYSPNKDNFLYENRKKALYFWEKGRAFRVYINDENEVEREEFMYIHLQKRKMEMQIESYLKTDSFKITNHAFVELNKDVMSPCYLRKELYFRYHKNKIIECFIHVAGFIYAIRKGINPFKVEIVKRNKIKWLPKYWYRWINFIPNSHDPIYKNLLLSGNITNGNESV